MTDVIAFVIALGFGFGLSLWIFSTIAISSIPCSEASRI